MSKEDNALFRSLATQLAILAMMGGGKPERRRAIADACEQVAARLREQAAQEDGAVT